jgi:hypothetical protein
MDKINTRSSEHFYELSIPNLLWRKWNTLDIVLGLAKPKRVHQGNESEINKEKIDAHRLKNRDW